LCEITSGNVGSRAAGQTGTRKRGKRGDQAKRFSLGAKESEGSDGGTAKKRGGLKKLWRLEWGGR